MIKLVMIYKKVNQKINQMIKKYIIKICDINFKK